MTTLLGVLSKNCTVTSKADEPLVFFPFLTADNTNPKDTSSAVMDVGGSYQRSVAFDYNGKSLNTLLRLNAFYFLREMLFNTGLEIFLKSYLANRAKPFHGGATSTTHLDSLDRSVLMIFLRIVSGDYRDIENNLPQEQLQISVVKKEAEADADADAATSSFFLSPEELESQYKQLLSEKLKILRFQHVLDIVSIVGESNADLSASFVQQLVDLRGPTLSKEIKKSVVQTEQVRIGIQQELAISNC